MGLRSRPNQNVARWRGSGSLVSTAMCASEQFAQYPQGIIAVEPSKDSVSHVELLYRTRVDKCWKFSCECQDCSTSPGSDCRCAVDGTFGNVRQWAAAVMPAGIRCRPIFVRRCAQNDNGLTWDMRTAAGTHMSSRSMTLMATSRCTSLSHLSDKRQQCFPDARR